jgi:hypothetical protein
MPFLCPCPVVLGIVVPVPPPATPRSLLKMKVVRPHLEPIKSQTLVGGSPVIYGLASLTDDFDVQ